MNKNTLFFFFFMFIFANNNGISQRSQKVIEKDTINGWEVGLDLLWLIDKNSVPEKSVFIRYNFGKNNKGGRAIRLRVGFDFMNQDSFMVRSEFSTRKEDLNMFSGFLRLGYEWERNISQKTSFFYALDASVSKMQMGAEFINRFNGRVLITADQMWEVGIIPVGGFKYKPTNRIVVSIESSLNFIYMNRKRNVTEAMLSTPDQMIDLPEENIDLKEFSTTLIPISVINFSYRF